jgi:hypothetical protein
MKIQKVTKIWTTKNGGKIRICDMTDSHLNNTIAMIERKAENTFLEVMSSYPSFGGEMAQYYAEQEWESMANQGEIDPNEISSLYDDLIREQNRRSLEKTN